MNYGRYFKLDLGSSSIINGVSIFSYCEVQFRQYSEDTPKYPIYITIKPDGVFFYVHYALDKNLECNDMGDVLLQNNPILSLPIASSADSDCELTDNINKAFSIIYPDETMDKCVYDFILKNIDTCEQNNTSLLNGDSYSTLDIFDAQYNVEEGREKPIESLLRKLFLDFLFDLEYTSLFENVPYIENIKSKFYENFLFSAIKNKAEYYYQRQQLISLKHTSPLSMGLFYSDFYSEAEHRWVETITHPAAYDCFYYSGWFSGVEEEMKAIYIEQGCYDYISKIECNEDKNSHHVNLKAKAKETAESSANWFIDRYNIDGVFSIWYGSKSYIASFLLISFLLITSSILIAPMPGSGVWWQILSSLALLSITVGYWVTRCLISKRSFTKAVGVINVMMPRLFASILAAWFTLAIGEDIFKGFFDINHDWVVSCPLIIIVFIFVYYEIGKINRHLDRKIKLYRSIVLMLVAFVYAFISGVFIIDFFGGQYLERSDYIDEFYINNVFPENPMYVINKDRQQIITHDIFYKSIARHNNELIPFIATELSPQLLKLDRMHDADSVLCQSYQVGNYMIDYRVTLLLVDEFIKCADNSSIEMVNEVLFEGSTLKSRVDYVDKFCKRIYDHQDSVDITSITGQRHLTACIDLLKSIDNHQVYREVLHELRPSGSDKKRIMVKTYLNISIFREMLLQFTVFAMFIGVFIQLIFDDRSITKTI